MSSPTLPTITRLLALPDDCIRALLQPLPLWNLFVFRRVCHRFNTIIRLIFRSRHSLKLPRTELNRDACRHYPSRDLFSTRPPNGCTDVDVLLVSDSGPNRLPKDDHESIEEEKGEGSQTLGSRLSELLPRIRHLVAFTGYDPHSPRLQLLSDLLPNWSISLVTLTLIKWDKPGKQTEEFDLHRAALNRLLSDALNQLIHLRELHLLSFEYGSIRAPELMGPVLGRLESFTLQGFIYSSTVQPLIRHLGPAIRRLQLGINKDPFQMTRVREESLERCNPLLGHYLTHLSLSSAQVNSVTWVKLNALTHLDLSNVSAIPHYTQIMDPDLFVELSTSKPELRTLGFTINLFKFYLEKRAEKLTKQQQQPQNEKRIDDPPPPRPVVVASVSTLIIHGGYVGCFKHFAPYYPQLGRMFPRVSSISAIEYCSKEKGAPTKEVADQMRGKIERNIQPYFQAQNVKVDVQFELNRNVLSYYMPNLLFKERKHIS